VAELAVVGGIVAAVAGGKHEKRSQVGENMRSSAAGDKRSAAVVAQKRREQAYMLPLRRLRHCAIVKSTFYYKNRLFPAAIA
jgi:hypothetical protein